MRIAVWHNLPSGGGKRALYDQVAGLISRGHDVEAWCPPSANQEFLPLSELITEHQVPLGEPKPFGESRIERWKKLAWTTGRRMQVMEEHCRVCSEQIQAGDFDLVLVHPCRSFRASAMGRFLQIPKVMYLQEPFRDLYEAAPPLIWAAPWTVFKPRSLRYWYGQWIDTLQMHNKRVQVREEAFWMSHYDQILVNSQFSRESLIRTYNLDSRVCYLGIDTLKFSNSGSKKETFVVGLGNVWYNKRVEFAVEAVGSIDSEKRPKLLWIGNFSDDEYRQKIQDKASDLKVDLEFKVLVTDEQLTDLLSRAAVMIYTSHLEPFGYAPLEANACGTGVVAIAEGGVRETVADPRSGVLIQGLDAVEFGRAILKFTNDLDHASDFGCGAVEYVRSRWSQKDAIDRLELELSRILTLSR